MAKRTTEAVARTNARKAARQRKNKIRELEDQVRKEWKACKLGARSDLILSSHEIESRKSPKLRVLEKALANLKD